MLTPPEINAFIQRLNQELTQTEQELKEILNLFKQVEQQAKEGYDKSERLHRAIERDAAQSKI